jgi:two-component system, OmpR family, heavy metal sensor histidine kinase CusS
MLSVQRVREFCSTLRFRLVLWITLIVFFMVVIQNIAIREIEQRILRHRYDEFLQESMEEVSELVNRFEPVDEARLVAALAEKRRSYEHRSWFVQVYDERGKLIWSSANAPSFPAPTLDPQLLTPFDLMNHRVMEKRLKIASGNEFAIRCGFLQTALQEDIGLLNRYVLIASISILIVAPLGGYVIALRATQPMANITRTAAHLKPGNLEERLPIRGTNDEIDQLSQTINGMLDRLASFINQNRDFVANAAHELRSPLAAIRTSVEVGLNHSRTPEEYASILADVMEEITRLAGLVNRLLILAEGDAGRLGSKEQSTRLDKVVRESVEMFEAVADLRGVRLLIAETAPVLVRGDETYLRQVVRNLIDNAIKYNKDPGEVVIRLRIDAHKRQALLTIEDTGPGIDRAVLPRIFERFYRADPSRRRDQERAGYGLGLSICRTVVQALEGDIGVESEVGRGSSFTVRLPLSDETPSTQLMEKPLPAASGV